MDEKRWQLNNSLIAAIKSFLENKDLDINDIHRIIKKSSAIATIHAVIFMNHLININLKCANPTYKISALYRLLSCLVANVPPVIYMKQNFPLIFNSGSLTLIQSDIYSRTEHRNSYIRKIAHPVFPSNIIYPSYISETPQKPIRSLDFPIELETDPAYQLDCMNEFRYFILNRAPINRFKFLINNKNSKKLLTKSICTILYQLNHLTHASHEQLLFSFNSIFLYIQAFAISNDIDGEVFINYLTAEPFYSPFLILAIINHVTPNLYLYNYVIQSHFYDGYIMVDLCDTKTLNNIISVIPQVFEKYVSPTFVEHPEDMEIPGSLFDYFISIQTKPTGIYSKMKMVLGYCRSETLTPTHISFMGILLLRCTILSLQRTLIQCVDSHMFNNSFLRSLDCMLTVLAPTLHESMRFYDPQDHQTRQYTFCSICRLKLPVYMQSHLAPYLLRMAIELSNDEKCFHISHILILRLLLCTDPFLSSKLCKAIKESKDIVVGLLFTNFFIKFDRSNTCQEAQTVLQMQKDIIKQFGFSIHFEKDFFALEFLEQKAPHQVL